MELGVVAGAFLLVYVFLLGMHSCFLLFLQSFGFSRELSISSWLQVLYEFLMCNVHFVCRIKSCSTKFNTLDHGGVCYYQLWVSPIPTSLVKGTIFFFPPSFCSWASPSLGGTIRNVTTSFSCTHQTLKNINKHFH